MERILDFGIEKKITVGVVIAATAIIIALGAVDVHNDTQRLENQLTSKSLSVTNRLGLSVRGPLWDLDDQQVSDLVISEMNDPEIYSVMVYGDAPGAPPITMKRRGESWEVVEMVRAQGGLDYASSTQITRGDELLGSVHVSLSKHLMQTRLKEITKPWYLP